MPDTSALRTMMVDTQIRPSDVTKFPIINAMLTVARENFVPQNAREIAYADGPIPLSDGRAMLEPRTLAKMLDALNLQPHEMVLIIGAGPGYSAAIAAHMVEAVVALEEDAEMAREAETQLSEAAADNVAVITGPLSEGAAKHGPFDVILVDGGLSDVPGALLEQLKDEGRIGAIFMEGPLGTCRIGYKTGGQTTWRTAFNATAEILPGFEKKPAFQL